MNAIKIFRSSEFIYYLLIVTEKPAIKSLVHKSLVWNVEEYHSYKSTADFSLSLLQRNSWRISKRG